MSYDFNLSSLIDFNDSDYGQPVFNNTYLEYLEENKDLIDLRPSLLKLARKFTRITGEEAVGPSLHLIKSADSTVQGAINQLEALPEVVKDNYADEVDMYLTMFRNIKKTDIPKYFTKMKEKLNMKDSSFPHDAYLLFLTSYGEIELKIRELIFAYYDSLDTADYLLYLANEEYKNTKDKSYLPIIAALEVPKVQDSINNNTRKRVSNIRRYNYIYFAKFSTMRI